LAVNGEKLLTNPSLNAVKITGGGNSATGIRNDNAGAPQLTNVTIIAEGKPSNFLTGLRIDNGAAPVVDSSTITLTVPSPTPAPLAYAIDINAASATVRHSQIKIDAPDGSSRIGINNIPAALADPKLNLLLDDVEIQQPSGGPGIICINTLVSNVSHDIGVRDSVLLGSFSASADNATLGVFVVNSVLLSAPPPTETGGGMVNYMCAGDIDGDFASYNGTCGN